MRIQRKLLDYYTECLANLPKRFSSAERYLFKKHIQLGICNTAMCEFKKYIGNNVWVHKYTLKSDLNWTNYWGPTPFSGGTRKEIVEALQLRIDILTKECKRLKI